MDTIENKLATALEALTAKDAEVTEARSSFEKVAAENLDLTAKVAELTEKVAALEAAKVAAVEQAVAIVESQVSASEEAAKIAASVGVAPVETNPAADAAPKADILEQYMSLTGLERSAFFAANRAAIMGALRK